MPVRYQNFLNRGKFSFIICKERLVVNQLVFYLQKNHYLTEKFSEKIEWFREFGITNHILAKYVDTSFKNKRNADEKEAMKFHELSAIFGLWFAGLMMSSLVLIFEILYNTRLRKKNY